MEQLTHAEEGDPGQDGPEDTKEPKAAGAGEGSGAPGDSSPSDKGRPETGFRSGLDDILSEEYDEEDEEAPQEKEAEVKGPAKPDVFDVTYTPENDTADAAFEGK